MKEPSNATHHSTSPTEFHADAPSIWKGMLLHGTHFRVVQKLLTPSLHTVSNSLSSSSTPGSISTFQLWYRPKAKHLLYAPSNLQTSFVARVFLCHTTAVTGYYRGRRACRRKMMKPRRSAMTICYSPRYCSLALSSSSAVLLKQTQQDDCTSWKSATAQKGARS
jgi:hypothetical protein